jgi:hypothetical protein
MPEMKHLTRDAIRALETAEREAKKVNCEAAADEAQDASRELDGLERIYPEDQAYWVAAMGVNAEIEDELEDCAR